MSRFGDERRMLSMFCLSSSKKTFIMTMSPVERVWQAISFRESIIDAGGVDDGVLLLDSCLLWLNLLNFEMSVVLDRLELVEKRKNFKFETFY